MLGGVPTLREPVITPRRRVAAGCPIASVEPDLGVLEAERLAMTAKALADPTRLRILDVLRKAAPQAICQCELAPLFEISQQGLSKHLKVLISAGVVESERRGLWTHYFLAPVGLRSLRRWLI
jgi:ArsR family transcriptional regulator